jgi:1-acyl-sn-glycerol-3-phosphate acyltransferase
LNFNKIKYLIYGFFLTRKYGRKLQYIPEHIEKKRVRLEYSKIFFSKLNIQIIIENKEKIPLDGQYLIFSNHRSILDPLAIDIVLQESTIFGLWIAKKELYNSLLFGTAVSNGGCIRLDREEKDTKIFFTDIKDGLAHGSSICIFPEGTRNKSKKDLLEFKNGVRIIAIKNKLSLLPIYIKSNASKVLQQALLDNSIQREITIVVGDIISYSEKNDLETSYRKMFNLDT